MTPLTLYNKNKIEYINVPCDFIDHYLLEAPGEFVKIYLYLLRCVEADNISPTLSDVADRFNFTENDVLRALKYWEKQSLLSLVYDSDKQLCGIDFHNIEPPLARPRKENPKTVNAEKIKDTSLKASASFVSPKSDMPSIPKRKYTKAELAKLMDNPEADQIIFIAEQYLGTTFNPAEMESLLYIYDRLGFSSDLIEYLLGVCVEKRIHNVSHIEEMAIDWYKNGISTIADAKKTNSAQRKASTAICKALGIDGRSLAESEQMFLLKWNTTYGFSLDFILEACHRTIQATGKPSFNYIDSILKNWHEAGVSSMEDVQALDAAHQLATQTKKAPAKARSTASKAKGNAFPERSYDYSALEQQLLNV